MSPCISCVIPAYNEEANIRAITKEVIAIFDSLKGKYTYEIILVDDGSEDMTWDAISDMGKSDPQVKWVRLSRNFWKEIALTAWIEHAKGDAAITLDADGQHPVEKIPAFIEEWEKGFQIVYNRRPVTQGVPLLKRWSSKLFYALFNTVSDFKLEPGTTDYRLLDRSVIDVFLQFHEKNRTYRGLIDWIGFEKKCLVFDAAPRMRWMASYRYGKLLKLAINNLTSFSLFPLKLVWYMGLFLTSMSFIILIVQILDKLQIFHFWFTNLGIVIVLNTIMIGIVLMSLWLIGLYIANIHEEVIGRPLYIIKDKKNV